MGCTNSKLDDLPAVTLCRDRCASLDEAIHQRYAFAEAHVAYLHSLKAVGLSLHRFFSLDLDHSSYAAGGPPSPVLNLPKHRKGDPEPSGSPPSKAAAIHHSHSNSGSHLHFHSDDEDDDSASESLHHLHLDHYSDDHDSPVHHLPYVQMNYPDPHDESETLGSYPMAMSGGGGGGGGFMNINYMRNKATPSVSYEQSPMSSETFHMGQSSSSYYPLPYAYPNNPNNDNSNHPNPSTSSYSYSNYDGFSSYSGSGSGGGGMNGFFGSPIPPRYGSSSPSLPIGAVGSSSAASSSKAPPPPPSPPRASAWDFLNPFESFEKFYPMPSYTPSRDYKEVREEEGIPDLEDDYYQQHEVIKQVDGDRKFVDGGLGNTKNYAKAVALDEGGKAVNDSEVLYQTRPRVSVENEVHMVDKKVVDNKDKSAAGDRGGNVAAAFKARGGLHGGSEVVREIQVQFENASESGSELAKMLEAGKLPYHRKHAAYQASAKLLHVITPPLPVVYSEPSTSKNAESSSSIQKADPTQLDIDDEVAMRSTTLSSTLQKLYLWERKLYEEVKVEEKMRVDHERKCRKLKRQDERGAEALKVDTTRALVRSLSTKIRIAIQVVDKISVKINKLRDEELWPQLNEFIQGLTRMWRSMLDCHRGQCQVIGEARKLDAIASRKHLSDAHLEATLQLERELLSWTLRFSCWVGAQRGYVRALNNWLLKCLLYVPEETADGIAPFSPGRIGAPPVFIICNQWSQALERISDKEVVDSMRDFAMSILELWDRDKLEMRQRMMVNKDMERKVKILERDDQKIHKEIQALDKRIVLNSGEDNGHLVGGHVYQSDTSRSGSLQVSLLHIFEAMERFSALSLKAYEELLQRIEEEGLLAGENVTVS